MSSRLRKLTPALTALLAVLVLGACGDSHTKVTTGTYAGESGANAPYLDVGPLIYEVQLSRQLNPLSTEDHNYLEGIPPAERQPPPGYEWFGVFVQAYNNQSQPYAAATAPTISDTQGNQYSPIVPETTNEFGYRGGLVPPHAKLPAPDSTASFGPTQGSLLLYKIRTTSLANRPLEIHIVDPANAGTSASAELDV